MNRTIVILLMFLVIPMRIMADNYTELWKRVEAAAQKDLPQTQIKLLDKIAAKAERERSYGQLLKAQLWRAKVQTEVSPDSLQPAVERLRAAEERVGEKEPVLAAVYVQAAVTVACGLYPRQQSGETDGIRIAHYLGHGIQKRHIDHCVPVRHALGAAGCRQITGRAANCGAYHGGDRENHCDHGCTTAPF